MAALVDQEITIPPSVREQLGPRVAAAAIAWRLSRRQAQVLLLLALGESNKEIAARFDCAEVTVEYHVSALLRRSGAETRARLLAKFWLQLRLLATVYQ